MVYLIRLSLGIREQIVIVMIDILFLNQGDVLHRRRVRVQGHGQEDIAPQPELKPLPG